MGESYGPPVTREVKILNQMHLVRLHYMHHRSYVVYVTLLGSTWDTCSSLQATACLHAISLLQDLSFSICSQGCYIAVYRDSLVGHVMIMQKRKHSFISNSFYVWRDKENVAE